MTGEVRDFVPWKSEKPEDIAKQIAAQIKEEQSDGMAVALMATIVIADPESGLRRFVHVHSEMPPEMMYWVAGSIQRYAVTSAVETDEDE